MTPEGIFLCVTFGIVPFWLLLLILPKWSWTDRIANSIWIPMASGLIYLYCQIVDAEPPAGAGFSSLEGIMLLFSSKYAMLAAWIHFVVIDFFVGTWQVRDSIRNGIKHRWVIPSLILTFAMAPIGLALYLIVRAFLRKKITLQEAA